MSSDKTTLSDYGATKSMRCHDCGRRCHGNKWNRTPQGRKYCPDCGAISKDEQGAFDGW